MKNQRPFTLLTRTLAVAYGVAATTLAAFGNPACVIPALGDQPFNPPIRIQLTDGTNGVSANSTGNPASFVTITLANVPGGYSVSNGTYLGWCVDAPGPLCPRQVPECLNSIYKPILISSCDAVSLQQAGVPVTNWDKINYIINNRQKWANAHCNVSELQCAIWRFLGFDAIVEAELLGGNFGFGFPAGSAGNVDAIFADASTNGVGFVPATGQVGAVVLQLPAAYQDQVAPPYQYREGQLIFIEVPCEPILVRGDTATIGFWQNKNGQALIKAANGGRTAKVLATWLADNFPYCYGANAGKNNLTNKTNADVAALFVKFFNVSGTKTDAQVLAAALATYLTSSNLAGNVAAAYGFNVSPAGTGAKVYNVGSYGTAIGLSNNTSYTVLELLQQANLQKQNGTFNANAFNAIFDGINQMGDRY